MKKGGDLSDSNKIMKVQIYDPAMCCPSGLCGPSIDPELLRINDAVLALKKQGVDVQRFSLSQQPKEFLNNKEVAELLHKNGKQVLPITIVNGRILKMGSYPEYEEMCSALGIEPLKKGRPMSLKTG